MKNLFLALIVVGLTLAGYGLYECNAINEIAMQMGHISPKDNLQSELCIKAGCYYVSAEDKNNHEINSFITAIGVFIFIISLLAKRIYEKNSLILGNKCYSYID